MNSVGYHESMSFCVKINSKPVDCTKPKIAREVTNCDGKMGTFCSTLFSRQTIYAPHDIQYGKQQRLPKKGYFYIKLTNIRQPNENSLFAADRFIEAQEDLAPRYRL